MRNLFPRIFATPVIIASAQNTFSVQVVRKLWVSRAQTLNLSPASQPAPSTMWVTPNVCTQRSGLFSTPPPTSNFPFLNLLLWALSPSSTGPIKNPTIFKKENRS